MNKRKTKQIIDIKENLHLLDWFEDFDIPVGLMSNEFKISIKDRFISNASFFDQRSSNEGFLFLLFYLFLFTSENTPRFFAIDNIETGFNPKLCTKLMATLTKLAAKYKKQVIITTHNPAILDGIDLKDDAQRLFIAHRNKQGKTFLERIEAKTQSKMKLSELWMKGYIGGLPDNF
jgi:predicted ATPase